MKVLVTGGAGYVGALLVPQLLAEGHQVTVLDNLMFGHGYLPTDNGNLSIINADVRDAQSYYDHLWGKDAVIYLASVSNNAMCEKDPKFSQSVNVDGFNDFVTLAKAREIKRFIYASSVAVYGSSSEEATEDMVLFPTTLYASAKAQCEGILLLHQSKDFATVRVRSASVCGYSPNIAFHLTINKMVNDAVRKGAITINGGNQKRSHIHIKDLCDFYKLMLTVPAEKISGHAFNVARENMEMLDAGALVSRETGAPVSYQPYTDDRTYSVSNTKAMEVLNFAASRTIAMGIREIYDRMKQGQWADSQDNAKYQRITDGIA